MADNPRELSRLGIILGGVVLVALALFLFTGGHLGGIQKVEGDADLPPVTSPAPPGNTGAR